MKTVFVVSWLPSSLHADALKSLARRRVSASGYIEERLKTVRVKLSRSNKAHRRHVSVKLQITQFHFAF
jgi:hypothetical protein